MMPIVAEAPENPRVAASLEKTRSAERWLLSRSDLGRAERMAACL